MNAYNVARWVVVPIFAWASLASVHFGQDATKNAEAKDVGNPPIAKLDSAAIAKLDKQLESPDGKTREQATKELSKLDEIPDILRQATKSADLEGRLRAQAIVKIITERIEEKAFQATVADLSKVELGRFIRRMITEEKFAGDKQWKLIEAVAKAVTRRANYLAEKKYPVPTFDMKSMPLANLDVERDEFRSKRILLRDPNVGITSLSNSILLCSGFRPWITSIENSIVMVDGDFAGATRLINSVLIVSGKLGRFTFVEGSIILVNGEFGIKQGTGLDMDLFGAWTCNSSFLQCPNKNLGFTSSDDSVLIKTIPLATRSTSRVLDIDNGPLQMLKFSSPKNLPDEQLAWGKTVNGLAVAIFPAGRPDNYQLRWRNVGKEALELRCVRLCSNFGQNDDLLEHVYVKDPQGRLVPACRPDFPPRFLGEVLALRRSTVTLAPGKSYEETIDLLAYVEKPTKAAGRYKLSIELDIPTAPAAVQKGTTYWTGKIRSNELEMTFGK